MKTIKNLLLLLVAMITLSLASCGDDDEESGGEITGTIVGTWTGGSATFTINGEDLSTFLNEFRQLLIDGGFTEEGADAFLRGFEELFAEEFTEPFEGTMTFSEEGTYEATYSDGTDTGTWELSSDNRTLTLDAGTEDELAIEVVSLTDSRFEGLIQEEISEDIDLDGVAETSSISVTIVFTR